MIALVIVGLLMIFLLIHIIKWTFRKIAGDAINKVVGIGSGLANKVVDRALDVGEKGVVTGAQAVGKIVSEEMTKNDPNKMSSEITKLAQKYKGEITIPHVISELGLTNDQAQRHLWNLTSQKVCHTEIKDKQKVYIFPGFKEKRKVKICEYCETTFELQEVQNECPSCGASLKITTQTIS
jgi:rubrerythrin